MRVSQADIVIVPGYQGSEPEHWQSRWEQKLPSAKRIENVDWHKPQREDWTKAIADAVNTADKPVVIVAHSLGVPATVLAVPLFRRYVAGAFLVSPPDVTNPTIRPKHLMTFGPYPSDPLPFPSFVVASRDDPFSSYEKMEEAAAAWGSLLVDAGNSGHINKNSGHGPWPEGLMTFGKFMANLSPDPLPERSLRP